MRIKSNIRPIHKCIALFLTVVLVGELALPTVAHAISGPTQTDFNGFTSSESTEMVDLSSGDFKYDIPLMTVPGPDGGYPIVLSYNAGVGMYDEASWVGLGWNLNPGVINRQMRGLPDDFNGLHNDEITKTDYVRSNTTVALSIGSDLTALIPEVYGFDFSNIAQQANFTLPAKYTMYYNTYAGLGSRFGIGGGISTVLGNACGIGGSANFNLSIDSNEGSEFDADASVSSTVGLIKVGGSRGFTYNPRGGITAVRKNLSFGLTHIPRTMIKAGGTFATSTHIPDVSIPMVGVNAALTVDIEAGALGTHLNIPITLEGNFSTLVVKDKTRKFKPYGYMYSHLRESGGEKCLMDYNKDNDVAVNMKLPSLPVPVATNDIYTIKGVGGAGVFRPMRNDAGIYYAPDGFTKSAGASVGLEVAAAAGFKAAADISGYYSSSYTGKWRQDYANLSDKLGFHSYPGLGTNEIRTEEPFYFRMLGEKTPMQNYDLYKIFDETTPSSISIIPTDALIEEYDPNDIPEYEGDYPFSGMQKFRAGIKNDMNGKPIPVYKRNLREKRTALVEYRTVAEIKVGGSEFFKGTNHVNPYDNNPANGYTLTYFDFSQNHIQDNHVGEFSILQTDGSRYHYGIPAYNMFQKEAVFSCVPAGVVTPPMYEAENSAPLISYAPSMHNNPTNNSSRDKYVSINEISPYSHAHLLTNITSSDYVDLTNNGPSPDDYGSYTKFNYNRFSDNFKWRIPYTKDLNQAINLKGYLSVGYDNKAAFTYGTKELWYIQSIETKTHIAFFYTSNRHDGCQALGENGGRDVTSPTLQKLDKIILYSKKDLTKPIQTVEFAYSYDLCPGVPTNNETSAAETHPTNPSRNANHKKGKLTLMKVTIINESSLKGRLTPYVFEYATDIDNINENPPYVYGNTDRWGTYRPDDYLMYDGMKAKNETNPYTAQRVDNKPQLDLQASAWNLKKINTPAGSTIKIEYEADDYGYVQDVQAQQLMQIVGTGNVNRSTDEYDESKDRVFGQTIPSVIDPLVKVPIRENFRRIYFRPEQALPGANDTERKASVLKYLQGIPNNQVYFKVCERLQIPKEIKTSPTHVSDYVTGYMEMEAPAGNNYGFITVGGERLGYFTIKSVSQKGRNPLRVAGLQYLRFRRPDLAATAPNGEQNAAQAILGSIPLFFSSLEMIFGFYTWAIMKGHCEYLSNDMPSYVRLQSPDKIKYGGGHRVKKITVTDGWGNMTGNAETGASYEQNFVYKTKENNVIISSGVASYEPEVGGDENALKVPYYYDPDNKFINNDPAFFIEKPIEESYYPAPQVVYSKVLVYNSATEEVAASGSGISVTEYYTAKDYPTVSKSTTPQRMQPNDNVTFIPFIASIQFRVLGYSQAYSVEVNDMPGKLKATYTYPSNFWDSNAKYLSDETKYLSFKKYIYNRTEPQPESITPYSWAENYRVLSEDAENTERAPLGLDFELFSELKESSDFTLSGGAQINGGADMAPYMIFITALPSFEYLENSARTVVTNKIIYRTGILSEVISYDQGNVERVMNWVFDKETGDPIITMTTSDYDDQTTPAYNKPTYNYDMPSHWYERGMGGAYSNYRIDAKLTINASGQATAGMDVFIPGDEVYCSTCSSGFKKLWVMEVTDTYVRFANKSGVNFNGANGVFPLTVMRSGKRNLQDAVSGNIVSTSAPNGPGTNPLFEAFNAANSVGGHLTGETPYSFPDCLNPEVVHTGTMKLAVGNPSKIVFDPTSSECRPIEIPVPGVNSYSQLAGYYLYPGAVPNTAKVVHGTTSTIRPFTGPMSDCEISTCMSGILEASAVEYTSIHNAFDAADLPQPSMNDYASGKKGLHRLIRSNVYFALRSQSNAVSSTQFPTFTGEDGTYIFSKFDFGRGNGSNIQKITGWRWAMQSPGYGYTLDGKTLQTQDAMDILSSNLYGYERNLVVASASNASCREIGFDGFEEYADGTYNTTNVSGKLLFSTGGGQTLSIVSDKAHTGKKSLKCSGYGGTSAFHLIGIPVVAGPGSNHTTSSKSIQLIQNKKYVISCWVNLDYPNGNLTALSITSGSTTVTPLSLDIGKSQIDGWRRVECVFQVPASISTLDIKILPASSHLYMDDIRLHPFNSAMKSMVYDNVKYIPLAELDAMNYATFYGYDEEGKVVVVKKETENGIYTVGHTRQNIQK